MLCLLTVLKNLTTAFISILCMHTCAHLLLFRLQGRMAAISPAESHIVSYVAYFSLDISFMPGACGERRSICEHCLTLAEVES